MTDEDPSKNEDDFANNDIVLPLNGHFPPQPGAGPNYDLFDDQKGKIKWSPGPFNIPEPLWVEEPRIFSIKSVVQAHIHLFELDKDDIEIEFFAEGSFNKLFTIRSASKPSGTGAEYIFRVCLPAYPWYKLESEIATMELVRMCTDIPVPRVYIFDSDAENPVGHEWMIMDKIKGRPFCDTRESMTIEQKKKVAQTLADWMHQLSMLRFDEIGSVYRRWDEPDRGKAGFKVGPIIDQAFMADWRIEYKIHRGPYSSYQTFFRSLVDASLFEAVDLRQRKRSEYCAALEELSILEKTAEDCTSRWEREELEKAEEKWAGKSYEKETRISELRFKVEELSQDHDEDVDTVVWEKTSYPLLNVHGRPTDVFTRITKLCQGLHFVLPHLCPLERLGPDSTVLHHWDISDSNILVDDNGNLVALVDWEQVHTLPFSLINPYPSAIFDHYDMSQPPASLKGDKANDRDFISTYNTNMEYHENYLLRQTFKERLEELHSPHLEAFTEQEWDLKELLALARSASSMGNEKKVEELVEKVENDFGRGF
ncbi:hypothetical protein B0J12DRAFT_674684 [Macrophomina phaseolina]|uniref:Aminoglycoside phosphotransferase domain-containing protein n=1 Tax=Macrophomina phaseolina TaxID=35725 RepID=A0ABQ8G1F6_9PEZI|nr:hypothetical protein B0J12DRAFT_674684 [Macrophomina phaseolina]